MYPVGQNSVCGRLLSMLMSGMYGLQKYYGMLESVCVCVFPLGFGVVGRVLEITLQIGPVKNVCQKMLSCS